MEWLDAVDKNGEPTGQVVSRKQAHEEGIAHRTSHVWIVRRKGSSLQILLQKRSESKDSHPGCYDISSAGHIPAGVDYITSALRELEEELGVSCRAEELVYCGQRAFYFEDVFHGKPFKENQISNVYLLWLDRDEDTFSIQKEELSEVRWFDFETCLRAVRKRTIPHCIYEEELQMVLAEAKKKLHTE